MKDTIVVSGTTYRTVLQTKFGCEGCAFDEDSTGCGLAQQEQSCDSHNLIFKEVEPAKKADEGWRDNKGHMALPYGGHVEVQFRDGGGGGGTAGDLDWSLRGGSTDIVRYRFVSEPARNGRPAVIPITPVQAAEQATALNQAAGLYDTARPAGLAAAPAECRSPYCECDVGKCRNGWKDMRGEPTPVFAPLPAADATSKPTNPKDLIGVRKVPMSCVPAGVLMDVALALHEGACKYGRHNYRGVGVRASVYYDAAIGHLMDWWEGEDIDPDSDLSHVTKAIASLVVLRDAMLQGKLADDRPPRSRVLKRDFNRLAGEIIDRHADKSPYHWTIADSQKPTDPKGLS